MADNRPGRTSTRLPLLLPGGLALLAGLDAALALLGLPHVVIGDRLADVHGPLMVLGFVGTVISLERAVALGRTWGYLAPLLSGLGAIVLLTPLPIPVGAGLLTAAQLVLLLIYRSLHARQPAPAVAIQTLGAAMALCAALLWLAGVPVPALLAWLVGYLVLTILGERVELARLGTLTPRDLRLAQLAAVVLLLAATTTLLAPAAGFTLLGLGLLLVAGWLAARDVARRSVRASGLPRFIAVCLLVGYAWLAVAGAIWLLGGQVVGRGYDAATHAVFLGFVISMIMAHAPVILPAVLRRPLPYRPLFYLPAALLHVTLVLRLAVGDARDLEWAVQAGGVGNIVALLGFVLLAVVSVVRGTPGGSAVQDLPAQDPADARQPVRSAREPVSSPGTVPQGAS